MNRFLHCPLWISPEEHVGESVFKLLILFCFQVPSSLVVLHGMFPHRIYSFIAECKGMFHGLWINVWTVKEHRKEIGLLLLTLKYLSKDMHKDFLSQSFAKRASSWIPPCFFIIVTWKWRGIHGWYEDTAPWCFLLWWHSGFLSSFFSPVIVRSQKRAKSSRLAYFSLWMTGCWKTLKLYS